MILKMSEGLGKTCAIFFLTLLFSLPLGMIVTLLRMSKNKVISGITRFIISILRGTPLMLQLLAVTYGPYYLSLIHISRNGRRRSRRPRRCGSRSSTRVIAQGSSGSGACA